MDEKSMLKWKRKRTDIFMQRGKSMSSSDESSIEVRIIRGTKRARAQEEALEDDMDYTLDSKLSF